ncbi:MAG: UDP-glucose 4-epimerase GalE [Bacteroidales bacterium]|nr:UDP-glucose 4-epimerase GalE [Bacteroidales bacterium]
MPKKILVTGGTGYIGSHTCVVLLENGFDVLIVDNLSNSSPEVVDKITRITGKTPEFTKLDLCNEKALLQYFKSHPGIDGVIHFAAYKAVGESSEFPLKYYHNNLLGMVNLLKAMDSAGCDKLVFSSSCTVYGQPDVLPVSEDAPLKKAFSPYGNTKKICEDIMSDQVMSAGLKGIALRYFNPIGAHESALIGELPLGVPNNLIPYLTQTAIGKRESLKVFGKDYDTPDGTGIRDYIHVMDLAKAHLVAINRLIEKKNKENYEIFNLGTGTGYSVLDIILTFERVNGVKVNHEFVDRRPGDIEKVWANPEKANRELGWKAESGLEDMLRSAWKWEKTLKLTES